MNEPWRLEVGVTATADVRTEPHNDGTQQRIPICRFGKLEMRPLLGVAVSLFLLNCTRMICVHRGLAADTGSANRLLTL